VRYFRIRSDITILMQNRGNKQELIRQKIPKVVPVDDSSVRALKKGGKSTKAN
jgi:hypothetical protein